jgi:hypothetical protein
MASVNYTPGTVITSEWLNAIDALAYDSKVHVGISPYNLDRTGVSDCLSTLQTIVNTKQNHQIYFPRGTYRVNVTSAAGLTEMQNIEFVGDGRDSTEIIFYVDFDGVVDCMRTVGNVKFKNLKLTISSAQKNNIALVRQVGDGVSFYSCAIDGGITDSGSVGTESHFAYGVYVSNTINASDVLVFDCDITKFTRFCLKNNVATADNRRWKFLNSTFTTFYRTPISLNSPNGTFDDIIVNACTFRTNRGAVLGTPNCFFIGVTKCTNYRITNNIFDGKVNEAIHIEEGSNLGVIANNTANIEGDFVQVIDNNNSGSSLWNEHVSIVNNVANFTGVSKANGSRGVWLVNDASPERPAKRFIIAHNIFTNFQYGIATACVAADGISIKDNIAHECEYGYYGINGSQIFESNTSSFCTYVARSDWNAVFKDHRIIECLNFAAVIDRKVTFINPIWEFESFAVTASVNTDKTLFPYASSSRIYGELTTTVGTNGGTGDADWNVDSITKTTTSAPTITSLVNLSGPQTSASIVDGTTAVVLRITPSVNRSSVRPIVSLNGSLMLSA